MILNAAVTRSRVAFPPHVEEVRGLAPVELDDVHGGHGEPRPVHHAPDLAVESDVVEVVPARFDLGRVLLVLVAKGLELRATVERVVVEAHLRVEGHHPARAGEDEGIDLDDARIELDERPVEVREELRPRPRRVAGETEPERKTARMERLESGRGIDRDGEDLLGALLRDLLDVHPALGRGHRHHPPGSPVDEHGNVVLARDVAALLDVEPPHGPPRGPGLLREEHPAQHRTRVRPHLVEGAGNAHPAPALGISLEPARAPSPGMDLGLDHPGAAPPDRLGRRDRLAHRERGAAPRNRHAKGPQELLRLVLVDVHASSLPEDGRPAPGAGPRPSFTGYIIAWIPKPANPLSLKFFRNMSRRRAAAAS